MILVAGLGITGQSVIQYLNRNQQACVGFDTREDFCVEKLQQQFVEVEFYTGQLPVDVTEQITQIILSPGISLKEIWLDFFKKNKISIIGDIELFAQAVSKPIISITGSNGKSTVTSLVAEILSEAGYQVGMGGNIGVPALDLLSDESDYDVYVLELSSFQLETTYSLHSITATVLNISEDHMDRYDCLQAYISAKQRIFSHAESIILPVTAKNTNKFLKTKFFGENEKIMLNDNEIIRPNEMKQKGKHHVLNAQAAIALTEPFNVSLQDYKTVFKRFQGLAHRAQMVLEHNGVQWINDSKGTNVGATITAIESLGNATKNIILIAGGVGKGADFSPLTTITRQYCKQVILFGRDAKIIDSEIMHSKSLIVKNLSEAVKIAAENSLAGDIVLFSPACASFDQFTNYVHRGEVFEALAKNLKELSL